MLKTEATGVDKVQFTSRTLKEESVVKLNTQRIHDITLLPDSQSQLSW